MWCSVHGAGLLKSTSVVRVISHLVTSREFSSPASFSGVEAMENIFLWKRVYSWRGTSLPAAIDESVHIHVQGKKTSMTLYWPEILGPSYHFGCQSANLLHEYQTKSEVVKWGEPLTTTSLVILMLARPWWYGRPWKVATAILSSTLLFNINHASSSGLLSTIHLEAAILSATLLNSSHHF